MMPPGIRPGESPPFHRLNEYVFQDLCRDLLDTEPSIATCEVYGTRGQSQDGIDLLAYRSDGDGIEVGQCKCCADFPPRHIRKASDEFLAHWERWSRENVKRFILFVACDMDQRQRHDEIGKQKKCFEAVGIIYEVWSAAKIRSKLRLYPAIVASYCTPAEHWVQVICGMALSAYPLVSGGEAQRSVAVDAALLSQQEQLIAWVSSEAEQRLEVIRTAWREGRRDEVFRWLKGVKSDVARWRLLSPEVRARLLCFEASLELEVTRNISRAKQLADEAQALAPSDNQARLRALIAYQETGLEAALGLLDGQEDIDSRNLRAALLLEMGRVEESLGILNF